MTRQDTQAREQALAVRQAIGLADLYFGQRGSALGMTWGIEFGRDGGMHPKDAPG